MGRHYFWSNFAIPKYASSRNFNLNNTGYRNSKPSRDKANELELWLGFDLSKYKLGYKKKERLLRNCTHPNIGAHILNYAFKEKQEVLI